MKLNLGGIYRLINDKNQDYVIVVYADDNDVYIYELELEKEMVSNKIINQQIEEYADKRFYLNSTDFILMKYNELIKNLDGYLGKIESYNLQFLRDELQHAKRLGLI